jgi:ankyrin repeat protein
MLDDDLSKGIRNMEEVLRKLDEHAQTAQRINEQQPVLTKNTSDIQPTKSNESFEQTADSLDEKTVRMLMGGEIDIHARNAEGSTPLMAASLLGYTKSVKLLLEKGVDIAAKDEKYGLNSLMAAIMKGHFEIAKLLIEKGADVNAKDNNGNTPLKIVALKKQATMTTSTPDKSSENMIRLATSINGYSEVEGILLEKGATLDGKQSSCFVATSVHLLQKMLRKCRF